MESTAWVPRDGFHVMGFTGWVPRDGCHGTASIIRVGLKEFSGLVELADVVLDPFPVGGGRSSLEIFAVGVPVVMLYNRTSILQVGRHGTKDPRAWCPSDTAVPGVFRRCSFPATHDVAAKLHSRCRMFCHDFSMILYRSWG